MKWEKKLKGIENKITKEESEFLHNFGIVCAISVQISEIENLDLLIDLKKAINEKIKFINKIN